MEKGSGLGFFTVLGLIFIALKLMGYITWSWWLVLLPLYVSFAIGIILLAIVIYAVANRRL